MWEPLQLWMYGWGALLTAGGAGVAARPDRAAEGIRRFPRNRRWAWVLSGAALAWSAWVVRAMASGRFAFLSAWGFPVAAAVWVLANRYMEELLAPRAAGGLLLLAAEPWLAATRMQASVWSPIPATLAYLTVLAGIALLLHPYLFRLVFTPLLSPPRRLRRSGFILAAFGLGMAALGATVLR